MFDNSILDDDDLGLVRSLLAEMREKAHAEDETAQYMIRKYERLLRNELRAKARHGR